jgi:large subunit ribosomal protein L20
MRATKGAARTKSKRRIFDRAKGYFSGRRKLLRTAMETVERAGAFAYRDRRAKKRDFRRLWITRLSAACQERGLRYSQLIAGLKASKIALDRKSLSEIAIADPVAFDAVVGEVKKALKL